MKHTAGRATFSVLLLTVLLVSGFAAYSSASSTVKAASTATGEIVLIARDTIDLKWDPDNYPRPDQQFVRWELWRGLSTGSMTKIRSGTDQVVDHHRDSALTPGTTYYYRLDVVRCLAPCGSTDQVTNTFFSDSATAGVFQGTVHSSLILDSGIYNIGFGGINCGASVAVVDGATLKVGQGTTLQTAAGVSSAGLMANGGQLEITGATLKNVNIHYGDYFDETSSASGWVKDSQMLEGTTLVVIKLHGASEATVDGNSGAFGILANQQASLKARNNTMTGSIEVNQQATAIIENNQITNGDLRVNGYGTSGTPKADAHILNNTIKLDYDNTGIRVYNGATATVADNTISYLGEITSDESSVVIDATSAGTKLTAERNRINNGKIAAFWGPQITIADNVIDGEGSAITIGCSVCGSTVQATGSIERNTIQSGWGLEMWAGSEELTIRHNCIRDNYPGLTVDAAMSGPLNVQYNWWGHASGPSHESSPGYGDVIVGNNVVFKPWDTSATYCRTTPPPPAKPDLRVESVSMIQVVKGVTPLVEAKPLTVEAVLSSSKWIDQDVKVSLTYAGKTYNEFYILELDNVSKMFQLKSSTDSLRFWKKKQQIIYFFPKEAPFGTEVTAEVKIDSTADIEESDEENNVKSSTQPVVKTFWGSDPGDQRLRILFVNPWGSASGWIGALETAKRLQIGKELVNAMPVAPIDYYAGAGLDRDLDRSCSPDRNTVLYAKEKYRDLKLANGSYQLFVLSPRDGWWDPRCGDYTLPEAEADYDYSLLKSVPGLLFAHWEINPMRRAVLRALGAQTSSLSPGPKSAEIEGGWSVPERRILSSLLLAQRMKGGNSVRSFLLCNYYPSLKGYSWIDQASYQSFLKMHQTPALHSSQSTAVAGLVLVSGTITDDGQATFDPIFELTDGVASIASSGPYSLEFYGAGNHLLYHYDFDVDFTYEATEGPQVKDMAVFAFALPRYAATSRVVLTKEGAPLATLTISAHAPTVQVTYPNGGENLTGLQTVTWNAGDSDGDGLSYAVLYSGDSGATWENLAMGLTTKSFQWDTDQDRGSDKSGLIKVMASDGYHTTGDTSNGAFSVANKAPGAGIVAPFDGAVVTQNTPVIFEGAAYDLEEGWLEESALSWSSNKAGALGTGSSLTVSLSPGQHVIRLQATDSGGLRATAEITVTASSETRSDLSLTNEDISHSPSLTVASIGWLEAQVRNLVTDASAIASFYDGDPSSDGRLINQVGFAIDANSTESLGTDWIPYLAGTHEIYVVISDADPAEFNTANNQAMIQVQVAEAKYRSFLPVLRRSAIGQ